MSIFLVAAAFCAFALQVSLDTSFDYLRKSAEQGNIQAQYELASRYAQGVPPNPVEAARWFEIAARQGHTVAQFNLGQMYKEGRGVKQDYRQAAAWLRKAADRGHPLAQLQVGTMCAAGTGIDKDAVEGYKWLHLVILRSRGFMHDSAERTRDDIAREMTPDQIAEAQRQAKDWESRHPLATEVPGAFQARNRTNPVPIEQPKPPYTSEARLARVEGKILLMCVIRKDGTVGDTRILKGLGYGLDESAISTIQTEWRFKPGTLDGEPIDVEANVEVFFSLNLRKP